MAWCPEERASQGLRLHQEVWTGGRGVTAAASDMFEANWSFCQGSEVGGQRSDDKSGSLVSGSGD